MKRMIWLGLVLLAGCSAPGPGRVKGLEYPAVEYSEPQARHQVPLSEVGRRAMEQCRVKGEQRTVNSNQ